MSLDGYRVSHYYADNIRKHSDTHDDHIDAHLATPVLISTCLAGDAIGNIMAFLGRKILSRGILTFFCHGNPLPL